MIKILILLAVIFLIGILIGKIIIIPIYHLLRRDQEEIRDDLKKVEGDLKDK